MNVSPLIDLIFILLIFFVVTAVFLELRGLEPGARGGDPQPLEEEPLVARVNRDGSYSVDGQKVAPGTLAEAVGQAYRGSPRGAVVETFAEAPLGWTVRALDAFEGAGTGLVTMRLWDE